MHSYPDSCCTYRFLDSPVTFSSDWKLRIVWRNTSTVPWLLKQLKCDSLTSYSDYPQVQPTILYSSRWARTTDSLQHPCHGPDSHTSSPTKYVYVLVQFWRILAVVVRVTITYNMILLSTNKWQYAYMYVYTSCLFTMANLWQNTCYNNYLRRRIVCAIVPVRLIVPTFTIRTFLVFAF